MQNPLIMWADTILSANRMWMTSVSVITYRITPATWAKSLSHSQREMQLMVSEKPEAALESMAAALHSISLSRLSMGLRASEQAALMLKDFTLLDSNFTLEKMIDKHAKIVSDLINNSVDNCLDLSNSLARASAESVAPYYQRSAANAERLGGDLQCAALPAPGARVWR